MGVLDDLLDAMAQYEITYGVKPHEIVFTPEGYEAFKADLTARGMASFPSSATNPSFNGADIVIKEPAT